MKKEEKKNYLREIYFILAYDRLLRAAFAVYQLGRARFVYVC